MPRIGREIGRGAEGIVYENLDQPGWVVKEYYKAVYPPSRLVMSFKIWSRPGLFRVVLTTWCRPRLLLILDRTG